MSERVDTDWMNVGGMDVVDSAWEMSEDSSEVVCNDSLPPLRIAALPRDVSDGTSKQVVD